VFRGRIATQPSEVVRVLIDRSLDPSSAPAYQLYAQLMTWADKARTLRVRANADQPDQSIAAVAFGAEGIGLCRTEHMFFGEEKIGPMREMILADTVEARRAALAKLLPLQRADFAGIFRAMAGKPVTIRTLDPPLHEFLPHETEEQQALADALGIPLARVQERIAALHEFNPMLGFRGCRLGIIYPEITEMQARAIFEAAAQVQQEGIKVHPEVMIPLVGPREGAGAAGGDRAPRRRRGRAGRRQDRLQRRHHDRGAARRPHRRSDRHRGGILLLRHQRPDPDGAGRVA
jgi:pyruvate,orthophosphate dikinase